MIDADQLALYNSDGYCQKSELIPLDLITAARQRVHAMIEDQPQWSTGFWQMLDPKRQCNSKGQPIPVGIQRPALHEDVFMQIAGHPHLQAAMEDLLGDEVELYTDQIGVKHGFLNEEQGGRSYYHQDSYYWHIDPALGTNCWIPLDVVDHDAIALGIKPGTQRGWQLADHEDYYDEPKAGRIQDGEFKAYQRHRVPLDQVDYSDEKVFPMQPGDGLFFTNYTWHRSEANRSGETKMYYAIAYQLTEAAIARRERVTAGV